MRRAALAFAAFSALGGCSDPCVNTEVARRLSPDGALSAVLFSRNCGATVGYSTQISILATGEKAVGVGNAFVADTDYGSAAIGDWGGPWADMTWLSADRLTIRHSPGARIFEKRDSVAGVAISYEAGAR